MHAFIHSLIPLFVCSDPGTPVSGNDAANQLNTDMLDCLPNIDLSAIKQVIVKISSNPLSWLIIQSTNTQNKRTVVIALVSPISAYDYPSMRVVLHWAHRLPYKNICSPYSRGRALSKNLLGRAIILALGGSAKIIALPSVFLDIWK